MERDRLGRRRSPGQERGLRPRHPALPETWASRALRVTMSQADWARFEALVDSMTPAAPTHARACGLALSALMGSADLPAVEPPPVELTEEPHTYHQGRGMGT